MSLPIICAALFVGTAIGVSTVAALVILFRTKEDPPKDPN